MQWTLGRRLKAGLGLLLAGVLILGINSLIRIASLSGQIDQMVDVTSGPCSAPQSATSSRSYRPVSARS